MLIIHVGRAQLLRALSPGGIVVEVGVFRGRFAATILEITTPRQLHLIDPWLPESGSSPAEGVQMPAAYAEVLERFAEPIAREAVVLHRDTSVRVAPAFPDASLDWVYIDAMHDYEHVLADLEAFGPKVKPDGFILGHDFSNQARTRQRRFGVIPAVLEYTAAAGLEIVAMTSEDHPSYLLARLDNTTTLPSLRTRLLALSRVRPIEIHPSLLRFYDQVEVTFSDDRRGQLTRIGYRGAPGVAEPGPW